MDILMAFVDQVEIPDLQQGIGNADVTISK